MEEHRIWKQEECEQYEDNLSVVTITPTYPAFDPTPCARKSDAQMALIKKLKQFQENVRRSWKGVNVSTSGQPGRGGECNRVAKGVLLHRQRDFVLTRERRVISGLTQLTLVFRGTRRCSRQLS